MDDKGVDEQPEGGQGSTTYTAWDGDVRPWPPPENWYRAADGRWWHPAYGPDELPDSLPVWDASDPSTVLSSAEALLQAHVERNAEPQPESDPEPPAEITLDVKVRQRSGGPGPWATGALIAVAILGLATVAQIVFGGSNEDSGDTGREPAGAVARDDIGGLAVDVEGNEPVPASSPIRSAPGVNDSGGTDAGLIVPSESDFEVAGTEADFRQAMSENGLSTDELTDDQITMFASTYCVHAAGAEDQAAFDELRQIAVANSRSNLTPTQLDLTITTAVTVFCPAESERLGIGPDQSGP